MQGIVEATDGCGNVDDIRWIGAVEVRYVTVRGRREYTRLEVRLGWG